jgi:hypothetical protein
MLRETQAVRNTFGRAGKLVDLFAISEPSWPPRLILSLSPCSCIAIPFIFFQSYWPSWLASIVPCHLIYAKMDSCAF